MKQLSACSVLFLLVLSISQGTGIKKVEKLSRNKTLSKEKSPNDNLAKKFEIKIQGNNTGSSKRQNVVTFTRDPNEQRLFHLDETGTLHRHEVGPEEFSTPEGKSETFSNDKGVIDDSGDGGLQTTEAKSDDASPRQVMVPQQYSPLTSNHMAPLSHNHMIPAQTPSYGSMVPIHISPPPLRYYRPFPRIRPMVITPSRIQRVPYPVPVRIREPGITKTVPIPVPYAVPSPPKIQKVPVPVPVPIRTPPQVRIQRIPVPIPIPRYQPIIKRFPMFPRRYVYPYHVPMPVGLDECDTKPCRNGGTCYSVEETYKCHCATGFKGLHCEDTSKCHPNPCENMGECTVLQDGFECSCHKGFRGTRCEVKDQCLPNPCHNGGSCTSVDHEYGCSCIYGYIGKNCEVESKCFPLNPCQHGGTCHEDDFGYKCACIAGWDGLSCEIPDPCSSNPCYHGGVCNAHGNMYTCSCQDGYLGRTCELESQCHSTNPCQHGGRCHEHELDGYKCHCVGKWTGDNCEVPSYLSY